MVETGEVVVVNVALVVIPVPMGTFWRGKKAPSPSYAKALVVIENRARRRYELLFGNFIAIVGTTGRKLRLGDEWPKVNSARIGAGLCVLMYKMNIHDCVKKLEASV